MEWSEIKKQLPNDLTFSYQEMRLFEVMLIAVEYYKENKHKQKMDIQYFLSFQHDYNSIISSLKNSMKFHIDAGHYTALEQDLRRLRVVEGRWSNFTQMKL